MYRLLSLVIPLSHVFLAGHCSPTSSNQGVIDKYAQTNAQEPLWNSQQRVFAADESNELDDWTWVKPMTAASPLDGFKMKDRRRWRAICDNEEDPENFACRKALDGDETSLWLATRENGRPNTLQVQFPNIRNVTGIAMLPRQDDTRNIVGNPARHKVELSINERDWDVVAYGTWWKDHTEKFSNFEARPAQYVRLTIFSDAGETAYTAISEFNVYHKPVYTLPDPTLGIWGPTIDMPIVPVTAFVDPHTDKVVLLSSKEHHAFPQDQPAFTLTATWNGDDGLVTQGEVKRTYHNMFCPGMAFDADGRLIVSGGASGRRTTIFDGSKAGEDQWKQGGQLNIIRGYHSAVLMPDGRVFVLGGSWGAEALKDKRYWNKIGEIYDPKRDTWSTLPDCSAEALWTNDLEQDKKDDHLWLFTWKGNTVFQAGPSKEMHWYTVTGRGRTTTAGMRQPQGGILDDDAMCGESVMFDATTGRIATFGGADSYQNRGHASDKAFIITITEPNQRADVESINPLSYARTYASAVVVPNGDVFVAGGQSQQPKVFTDYNPVLHAEILHTDDGVWETLAKNSIVRTYHSWTILLPDATILNGGGGLCGENCAVNHFDAQLYTPPYLFTEEGGLAVRPQITFVSQSKVRLGDAVTIRTDKRVKSASLIRYSSTTHSVNTDQRRIPLNLQLIAETFYSFKIPSEGHIAIPGYWMLFVLDDNDVPSISKKIQIAIA